MGGSSSRRSRDDWLGFPITAGKYVYCEWQLPIISTVIGSAPGRICTLGGGISLQWDNFTGRHLLPGIPLQPVSSGVLGR